MDAVRLQKVQVPKIALSRVVIQEPGEKNFDYIRDGLVFHLDGINKGPNPGKWTDLVGGIPFTGDQSTTVFGRNYVKMQGYAPNDATVKTKAADGTIECVYRNEVKPDGDKKCIIFQNRQAALISFGYNHLGIPIVTKYIQPVFFDTTLPSTTVCDVAASATKKRLLLNGHVFAPPSAKYAWDENEHHLCLNVFNPNVRLYSIRIYNRHFTEEEMRHNQEVDIKRFNLHFETPISTLEYTDEDDSVYGQGQNVL